MTNAVKEIIPSADVKGFLTGALREMMAISKAQKGSMFLLRPDTGMLELAAYFAPSPLPIEMCSCKPGEGISGKIFEGRSPVLVEDITRDDRFTPNGFAHYRTVSFIAIPFVGIQERPLGVINLSDKSSGGAFSGQDLEFASTVAAYAAIIANNMKVAESLRREKEHLDEQKELLAKYASVGKLAAGVVHEINNPLDGIIRFTNMLLNLQDEKNSLPKDYLLEIKNGLGKIENVTRSLLQFSHHVNPKSMMIRNYVDVAKTVEEALIACEARKRTDITVRKEMAVSGRILDMGLSQVFVSMIQNAFDAMPSGGCLDISACIRDSQVRISFHDTGNGIPRGDTERIFDPFYTDKHSVERPGLGLAKCREIIDRYNGMIAVESVSGSGSSFHIIIPEKFLENE